MAKPRMCPRPGAIRFFERNAGYSRSPGETRVAGRKRSARRLAVAECLADEAGAEAIWEEDRSSPGEYCVTLKADIGEGRSDSICGVGEGDRDFGRLIEADLALSVFADEVDAVAGAVQRRRGRPVKI